MLQNLECAEGVNNILKPASLGKVDSLVADRSIKDLLTQARVVRKGEFGAPEAIQYEGAEE